MFKGLLFYFILCLSFKVFAVSPESIAPGKVEIKTPFRFEFEQTDLRLGMAVERKYHSQVWGDTVTFGTDFTLPVIRNANSLDDIHQIPNFSRHLTKEKLRFGINLKLFF